MTRLITADSPTDTPLRQKTSLYFFLVSGISPFEFLPSKLPTMMNSKWRCVPRFLRQIASRVQKGGQDRGVGGDGADARRLHERVEAPAHPRHVVTGLCRTGSVGRPEPPKNSPCRFFPHFGRVLSFDNNPFACKSAYRTCLMLRPAVASGLCMATTVNRPKPAQRSGFRSFRSPFGLVLSLDRPSVSFFLFVIITHIEL